MRHIRPKKKQEIRKRREKEQEKSYALIPKESKVYEILKEIDWGSPCKVFRDAFGICILSIFLGGILQLYHSGVERILSQLIGA